MVKMQVVYEGDLHTVTTHGPSGQTLHTDAPADNGGKAQTFSPTDLLAASLATCIATVLGIYTSRKGIDLRGMRLEVEKKMSTEGPRRLQAIYVDIWVPIELADPEKNTFEKVAKTCPVFNSLRQDVEHEIRFHWK